MIYVSHLLEDQEMKELLQSTRMGVESIEFSISYNLDHLTQTLRTYEKRLEAMGCEELILHGPFLDLNPAAFDSEIARVTRYRYEQAYAAAKTLGAKKIIYHSCHVPTVYMRQGWASRVAAFYKEFLGDKTDEIQILMENVLDPVPELLWECAEEITHPAFGLCLDVGHAHCYSKEPLGKWLKENEPYIRHLHVHDNCGDRDRHLALGQGNLPLEELGAWLQKGRLPLEKLESQLQKGVDCTIECNTQSDVLHTYAWIRKHLPKAERYGRERG